MNAFSDFQEILFIIRKKYTNITFVDLVIQLTIFFEMGNNHLKNYPHALQINYLTRSIFLRILQIALIYNNTFQNN